MIRAARVADAAAVTAVHRRSRAPWAAFLPRWEPPGEHVWELRLQAPDAETFVFDDGGVRGFVSVTAAGDEDLAGQPVGELLALYVDPDAQRRGVASALVEFAADRRRAAGDRELVLWTFAGNDSGRAFYTATGWTAEGASQQFDPDHGADEIRYRRPL